MAVIKIACPKCGQKVSGDESFYGRKVNCPICTSRIVFPSGPEEKASGGLPSADEPVPAGPEPAEPTFETIHPSRPQPTFDDLAPTAGAFSDQPMEDPIPPSQPAPHPPSFDDAPPQAASGSFPTVPAAPAPMSPDQHRDIPSPLLGTLSLVVGILNTITACVGGILFAPAGIILGHTALAKAKQSPVKPAPGHNLAIIGVILGYAGLVGSIILLCAVLVFKQPFFDWLATLKIARG